MQFAASASYLIGEMTQPSYPYYHPVQAALFAGCASLGTKCLTSIPGKKAAYLALVTYTISQCIAPIFSEWLETYRNVSLVPLIGQVVQIALSMIIAKLICGMIITSISFKEMRQISLAFLVTLCVFRLLIRGLRQQIQL